MYLCYLDESGVPEIPGNSTHFVLAGIAVPIERWREADAAISDIMSRYGLAGAELHTAWLLRKYLEQSRIAGFESMDWDQRRIQMAKLQVAETHRVRKLGISKRNSHLKKIYQHTSPYVHLTLDERQRLALELAETVGSWKWARLFAACIDKSHFLTTNRTDKVNTAAFAAILVMFARFLKEAEMCIAAENDTPDAVREFGLIIHDNNPTVAAKHTLQMQTIRQQVTSEPDIPLDQIIETPLFVDSSLTRMIQVSDLWGYTLRRYIENGETALFEALNCRSTTLGPKLRLPILGKSVHHFTEKPCPCAICVPDP